MSTPYTRHKCVICGDNFEIAMTKDRRAGWIEEDTSVQLNYGYEEQWSEQTVCGDCFEAIQNAVTDTVENLKKKVAK